MGYTWGDENSPVTLYTRTLLFKPFLFRESGFRCQVSGVRRKSPRAQTGTLKDGFSIQDDFLTTCQRR
jgi:hypothetical protein